MPVIGTAGHVDHGKSTLIRALTGRDPDRWVEEKERGLTIDLGFAWTTLPDGTEVSFVDVPGHQRFIKNMLSGIEAVDVALFVVAADEGWMPQSEEHLAVLDLLGVRRGVFAITKTDRVDPDLVTLATLEIEERIAGTTLEGSPIVPAAAPAGIGIEAIAQALADEVSAAMGTVQDMGCARMWIDRSFTITGSGTVVTGTLLDGPLAVDDVVMLWPGRLNARVRSLQSHEHALERVGPHTRVAANLVGLDRRQVARGAMLGIPDMWFPSRRLLAEIRTARYVDDPISGKGAFHLHLGSGAWPVRVRPLDSRYSLLSVDTPLPVTMGDRFIIREVGRRQVVAGGRVLDPGPVGRGGELLDAASALADVVDRSPSERATTLLEVRGRDRLDRLTSHTGGGSPQGLVAGGEALSTAMSDDLVGRIVEQVRAFHETNPLRPGISKADLAGRIGVTTQVIDALVAISVDVRDDGPVVAASGFSGDLGQEGDAALDTVTETLDAAGLTVPRISELAIGREMLHALVRKGDLVQVSDDLVYLPEQIRIITSGIGDLPNPFTVAQFRDRFGISRKYAVPLLEWLDASSITRRVGDLRHY
jgi:selenocysteine-specific elongation factor